MKIILFILIFCVIVISHEMGHFLLAKINGIRVIEFTIGMGPSIIKFERGGTIYGIRLLPIGGACIFDGYDSLEEKGKADSDKEAKKPEAPLFKDTEGTLEQKGGISFLNAGIWARISVIFAGPLFNFILAFLLSLIVVGAAGSDRPIVAGIMEGYPAEAAGIQEGDTICKINGASIYLYREVTLESYLNKGEAFNIVYERNGQKYETTIIPQYDEETGRYYIGLVGSGSYEKCTGFNLVKYSAYEVRYWISNTFKSLGMLISGKASKEDVSGPIGMAQVVGEVYDKAEDYGISAIAISMLDIAILLSANLGVINLLPLPALDGGRLVFLIIEAVRGKPVPPEKEGMVHFAGFVALMILMVFVMYNDILKLFA